VSLNTIGEQERKSSPYQWRWSEKTYLLGMQGNPDEKFEFPSTKMS
jgi:hypothetical protein